MSYHHTIHILIYEGDEDTKHHCFICDTIWEVANISNEAKQMAQFVGGICKRELT